MKNPHDDLFRGVHNDVIFISFAPLVGFQPKQRVKGVQKTLEYLLYFCLYQQNRDVTYMSSNTQLSDYICDGTLKEKQYLVFLGIVIQKTIQGHGKYLTVPY